MYHVAIIHRSDPPCESNQFHCFLIFDDVVTIQIAVNVWSSSFSSSSSSRNERFLIAAFDHDILKSRGSRLLDEMVSETGSLSFKLRRNKT